MTDVAYFFLADAAITAMITTRTSTPPPTNSQIVRLLLFLLPLDGGPDDGGRLVGGCPSIGGRGLTLGPLDGGTVPILRSIRH